MEVGLFSTVFLKRYHHEEMIRRASLAATSPISSTTRPKPPACNRRSVALKACSRLFAHLIQSRRSKSIPAVVAIVGAKTSLVSISAHTSRLVVAWANNENIKLVRPEETGPPALVDHVQPVKLDRYDDCSQQSGRKNDPF